MFFHKWLFMLAMNDYDGSNCENAVKGPVLFRFHSKFTGFSRMMVL